MSFSWTFTLWEEDVQPIDHEDSGPDRLGWQYKNSPRINSFLETFLQEVDYLEQVCRGMLAQRWPYTAEGVQLDNIGKIVDYDRPTGMTDNQYRIFCICKIYANQCDGRPEDLIKILTLAGQGISPERLKYREIYPAEIHIEVTDCPYPYTVFQVVRYGKPGGVLMDFAYSTDLDANTFQIHDTLSTVATGQSNGFGWSGDPTLGGKLPGVFRS